MTDHTMAMFLLHTVAMLLFVATTCGITAIANQESRSTALLAGTLALVLELPLFGSLTFITYCAN